MNSLQEKSIALAKHLDLFYLNGIVSIESEQDVKEMYNNAETELSFEDWFEEHTDLHLEFDFEFDEIRVEYDGCEYLVCTDAEADQLQDEELENYIDECILHELPQAYRNYFDRDAWKSDARYDGRGHCLSHYDGHEHEENVNGTYYYIYRTN